MALISRWQVSNFLDSAKRPSWTPDFIGETFDFGGQPSAVVMDNGTGKTSVADAMLWVLSLDQMLQANTAGRLAPTSSGAFSHIRVEFVIPSSADSDLFATMGERVAGEHHVFGIYANREAASNDPTKFSVERKFYTYKGVLEDVPVHREMIDDDGSVMKSILPDDEFLDILPPGSLVHKVSDWRVRVDEFIPWQQVKQMVEYQKRGGGDKAASFYNVEPRPKESFDQAFFRLHVAPEILSGVIEESDGDKGAQDVTFESGLVDQANEVVRAKLATEDKKRRLDRLTAGRLELDGVARAARTLLKAQTEQVEVIRRHSSNLNLARLVLEGGRIPGMPLTPEQLTAIPDDAVEDTKAPVSEILRHLCFDGTARVHEGILKHYSIPPRTGIEGSRAFKNNVYATVPVNFNLRQDTFIDLTFFVRQSGDEETRSRRAALLADVQKVIFTLCPFPVRRRFEVLQHELRLADQERKVLQETLNADLKTLNDITKRLNDFNALESAFLALVASGLFSETDLADPGALKARLEEGKATAEKNRDAHTALMADLKARKRSYDRVVAQFGTVDFADQANLLREAADQAKDASDDAVQEHANAVVRHDAAQKALGQAKTGRDNVQVEHDDLAAQAVHLERIEGEFGAERAPSDIAQDIRTDRAAADTDRRAAAAMLDKVRREQNDAQAAIAKSQRDIEGAQKTLDDLAALAAADTTFRERLPDYDPSAFDATLTRQIGEARQRRALDETERQQHQKLVDDLTAFTRTTGADDPAAWLLEKGQERERLQAEERAARGAMDAAQEKLTALESSPTAPSATDTAVRRALLAAGVMEHATALHKAITKREANKIRRRAFLSQFSALLFAPVFEDAEHALVAARALVASDLPMPVLLGSDVDQLVAGGDLRTTVSGDLHHGVLAGVTSRKVEAVLDPARLEQEKADLRAEIAALAETCQRLLGEIAALSPEGTLFALARSAQKAVDGRAAERIETLDAGIAALHDRERALSALRTEENLRLARDAAAFRQRGGDAAIAAARDALGAGRTALRSAEEALEIADAALEEWTERHEDARERFEASLRLEHWIPVAEKAQGFLDAGGREKVRALAEALRAAEEAVTAAEAHAVSCYEEVRRRQRVVDEASTACSKARDQRDVWSAALRDAASFVKEGALGHLASEAETAEALRKTVRSYEERLRFDFDSATAFKKTTDGSINEDRTAHALLEVKVAQLEERIQEKDGFLAANMGLKDTLGEHCRAVEQAILDIIREIEGNTAIIQEIKEGLNIDLSAAPPPASLDIPEAIREAIRILEQGLGAAGAEADYDAVASAYQQIVDVVRGFELKNAAVDIKRTHDDFERAKRSFNDAMERHTKASNLDQPTLVRLRAAKPEDVQGILDTIDAGIEREKQTWQEAVINEEKSRNELVGILKGLAISSADNLTIMQRVMAPTKENAGFLIEAKIAENEQIEKLLSDLVEQVEVQRKRFDEDTTAGRDHRREEEFRQSLSRSVRNRIHESMFPGARVKVVHPLMREGRPFHFVKQGISGGQATALMLLWTIKAATYSVERSAVKRQGEARRRLRRASHSIIVVDGLFSDLSDPPLIRESMEAMKRVRGNYQLIGLIHSPFYRNDFDLFPTCLFGRKVSTVGEEGVEGKMVTILSHTRDRAGRVGIAGLRARNTLAEAASRGRSSAAKSGADGESLDIFDSVIASTPLDEDEAATEDAR